MPEIKRRFDLQTAEHPHVLEYICTCGKPVVYYTDALPERLEKCFSCLTGIPDGELNEI